jgi:hypothetical protein
MWLMRGQLKFELVGSSSHQISGVVCCMFLEFGVLVEVSSGRNLKISYKI